MLGRISKTIWKNSECIEFHPLIPIPKSRFFLLKTPFLDTLNKKKIDPSDGVRVLYSIYENENSVPIDHYVDCSLNDFF